MVFSTEMIGAGPDRQSILSAKGSVQNPSIFVDFVQFAGTVFMDFEYIFHGLRQLH